MSILGLLALATLGAAAASEHRGSRGRAHVICAWCKTTIEEGDPENITNGACETCLEKLDRNREVSDEL